jgi:hypothetical protein
MSDDNVIPFPVGEIRNPLVDPGKPTHMDIASDVLYEALIVLINHGMDPKHDERLQRDMGVILNLMYAISARAAGEEHFLDDLLDEVSSTLIELKSELDNDNH